MGGREIGKIKRISKARIERLRPEMDKKIKQDLE
jgi:hypothetical protein